VRERVLVYVIPGALIRYTMNGMPVRSHNVDRWCSRMLAIAVRS